MDFNALKAFIAVAELESFSLAAQRLHLTQPAVSKRIALLEEQLNTRLIDRIGRKITLTEAGRILLPQAQTIMREISYARRSLTNLSGSVAGILKLGISHHLGLHRLPPVLREFSRAYPAVTLDIQFLDSEVAYQAVAAGDLELGIITLATRDAPKIQASVIWPDPLVFAVARDHELAHQPVNLQQLAAHNAILPDLGTFTGAIARQFFADHGLQLQVAMSTNFMETIKTMVSIGLGWGVLPKSLLDETLVELPIPNIDLRRNLGVIHHAERSLSNAANALLALLQSHAQP